jgi:hypothetical protein
MDNIPLTNEAPGRHRAELVLYTATKYQSVLWKLRGITTGLSCEPLSPHTRQIPILEDPERSFYKYFS